MITRSSVHMCMLICACVCVCGLSGYVVSIRSTIGELYVALICNSVKQILLLKNLVDKILSTLG